MRIIRNLLRMPAGAIGLTMMVIMTMLCVTHEMGFAQAVANRVVFMDQGQIVEENDPHEFFTNPQSDRTRLFLSQILGH